jgi:hypothetical protein
MLELITKAENWSTIRFESETSRVIYIRYREGRKVENEVASLSEIHVPRVFSVVENSGK